MTAHIHLSRIGSAILAVIVIVAIAHAAGPATERSASQSGPATYPKIINLTGTTMPVANFQRPTPPVMVTLDYKAEGIESILEDLSAKTGYVFIEAVPVSGRITFQSEKPVSSDDIPELLDTALNANRLGIVPTGRVLTVDTQAHIIGIPGPALSAGNDPEQIADTDNVIHQLVFLKTITAAAVMDQLKSIGIAPNDSTASGDGKSIVLTDTSAHVKCMVQIIRGMDQTDPTDSVFVRKLIHADAKAAAKQIAAMYPPTTAPANAPDAQNAGHHVLATAFDRTNQVIISGPVDKLREIQTLLDKLDPPGRMGGTTTHAPQSNNAPPDANRSRGAQ